MCRSWHQRRCLPVGVAIVFLSPIQFAAAVHTVFLETNMRAAWTALLETSSSSNNSSGWGSGAATGGGAREIVDEMLADCHSRKSTDWDAACDRALYLESVLVKVESTSSRSATTGVDPANVADEEQQQQQARLESAANEIAVVPAADLPFSAFFHEYAVPRRPVVILSEGSGGGASGDDTPADPGSREDQGDSSHDDGDTADHATDLPRQMEGAQRGRDDGTLLNAVNACLPYAAHQAGAATAAGTVEGPLRDCHEPLLENLLVPLHVSEDFAQRFRGQSVLPVGEHAEVESFVSSWHRIHRTRRGAYTPVTACPAGANTLLAVMSGTLEVLVYAPADGLPCLKPTFGDTPCSPSGAEGITHYVDEQGEHRSGLDDAAIHERLTKEQSESLDDETTGEDEGEESNMTPKPNPRALQEEALGLGRENSGEDDQSLPRSNFVDEMGVEVNTKGKGIDENVQLDEGSQTVGASKTTSKDNNGVERSKPPESLRWPHEPRYCADVWQQHGNQDDGTVARENAQEMSTGDKLFVPSGGAVSWRGKGSGREDEAIAARFCYVDASNFNSVKSHLPLYAAVDGGANGLLQAFRSPMFDTSMSRNPSAVLVTDFFAGNRHAAAAAATSASTMSSSSSSAGDDDFDADGSGAAAKGDEGQRRRRLSRIDEANSGSGSAFEGSGSGSTSLSSTSSESGRKGGRRGRKSFKEWQDDSRWDLKVLGLTLPTLDKPKVTGCERTACTVEWISSFVKQGQDQTRLGFNLSFVPAAATNASISGGGGGGSRGGGFVEVYVGDSRLKSKHALDRDLLNLGITEGKRHTVVVDTNLVPDTPYRFSVCVIYGETAGPYSELSKPARTTMVTAPLPVPSAPRGSPGAHAVTLHFPPPRDHGGSPVSWYHVMSRPTGENVMSKWQAVGMAPAPAEKQDVSVYDTEPQSVAIKVEHLVPGVAYQFRVCAQNDIGTSPWSSASDPVTVLAAAAGDTAGKDFSLSGFHSGHQHFRLPNVTDVTVSYAGELEPPPGEGFDPFEREVHGPTVVLDDRAGKVQVNTSGSTFGDIDVWTCHFSPQSFRVKAEVVVAQPADARGELENGRFVRNRLVVVERGDIPIVHKVLTAQRAGALGVIVADDGRCGNSFGQLCVHGSDPPVGWAALDMPRPWLEVRVPVVLMLREDADRLTAAAGAVAEEAESMAWSSLYDGWLDSMGSSSSTFG